ncbi:MAG: HAD family hydrolase [Gammaproteobacteria bacterium]|nr:HAD family hydrolase [Gammaproteobacteria bacterium]NNF49541.1 HAD family hydrolase [Woeseiaceae bacterium]MBT8093835.1 HAD family hydrolase [Gammaproteobacteria bacterium]MBT8105822.1 HAD family hydrolase [Gammaproteobacteria bacterium]NNK25836.1 HAD family hydrolase [Woeseiaceae bacterium]
MKDIRTITLDLDDTLWEIHPVIRRAELRLYEWLGDNYPRITEMFTLEATRELRARVLERHADRAHDLTFLRQTILSEIATAAGYTEFLVEEAFAVFDEVRNDVDMFPEARPTLVALRERFTLVALTNGNANLEKIGIADLFDAHINAQMAGAAKPERPIFDAAVEAGGASAAQTLHVGDHPWFDVHGARQAGLRTVWVNRSEQEWPDEYEAPDVEVRHIGELLELMR